MLSLLLLFFASARADGDFDYHMIKGHCYPADMVHLYINQKVNSSLYHGVAHLYGSGIRDNVLIKVKPGYVMGQGPGHFWFEYLGETRIQLTNGFSEIASLVRDCNPSKKTNIKTKP